jgi:hypothetical protein
LFVRNRVAIFLFQLGIQDRNRAIRAHGVTVAIRGVVSKRAKRKRVTVKVLESRSRARIKSPLRT